MPRNGSGTYVPPAGQPVVSGTTVSASVFNAYVNDVGTEMTKSICTDGQTPMAAALPMGNNKITGLATATLASDAARLDQVTTTANLAASSGASLVGFIQAGVGAVPWKTQDKLRETITNLDYAPDAERSAVLAGTSVMDLTTAMQAAIDAAGSTRRLRWLGIVNTGALTSSASVDWVFDAGAKIKQIPAVYGFTTWHINLTGPRVRVENADFDGNQGAMIAGQGSNGLLVSGISPTILHCKAHGYAGRGYDCNSVNTGVKRGLHIGCNFDDNAGLGLMTTAASYLDFNDCTFDRNGYGFQKTRVNYADTSHGFVAFGFAVRLRSHHLNFISCYARDNGRDGMNINQGSYAIKFAQCLAYGNDDGGFTIASDNTGSGLPGESEACYDIEYADCEAYNNYSGGLVAYQACHNVTVNGGRYYNNHRLAGNLAAATSYYNGIYFAGGSTGINVDAKVYDERQSRIITVVAGGVLTATGWIPGTMNYYPKVAIYAGADQSFRGYGKITTESAGSVTITPTTFNGVTLGAIIAGDYVTQAVQHNGVFTDNNCQGVVTADGAGHRIGATTSLTGRLISSAGFASGQNIMLSKERASYTELLANPSFDVSTANWTFSLPGGGAQGYYTGAFKRSAGALQIIAGTGDANADATLVANALDAVNGEFIEYGVWSYASARNDAYILFFWVIGGNTYNTIVQHPGGGWRYLKIGAMIPAGSTGVIARLGVTAFKTVYFDTASFKAVDLHSDTREFTFPSRSLPV